MIAQLTQTQAGFSKSERKVVAAILSNPVAATRSSSAQLAQSSAVSEPTINRFCKKLGASGFPHFKMQLALSLASDARFVNNTVAAEDSVDTFTPKFLMPV